MANVGFKRGPQANLEALVTNNKVIDGVFYLTSDTNRLYIGKGTNKLSPVNEGIITVANVADLDTLDATHKIAGAFCYVTGGNILCVYNGTKWIQINSVIKNTELQNVLSTDTDGIAVSTVVKQSEGADVQDVFHIKGTGTITASVQNKIITLHGSEHTYAIDAEDPSLTQDTNGNVEVALKTNLKMDGSTTASSTAEHNITLKSSDGSIKYTVDNDNNVIDLKGFIVSDNSLTAEALKDSATGFNVKLTGGQKTSTAHIDPQVEIKVGSGSPKTVATSKFTDGKASLALDVYTTAEVDNFFKSYNAMVYRGTVGTDSKVLPTNDVLIGDAYLAAAAYTFGGKSYAAGTLFVAASAGDKATSGDALGEDGYVNWTMVTGSTADTLYKLEDYTEGSAHGFVLKEANGAQQEQGKVLIASTDKDGNGIQISGDGTANTAVKINIGHKNTAFTPAPDNVAPANNSIVYISEISRDNYGHITGYTTKTANTQVAITKNEYAATADSSKTKADVKSTIILKQGGNSQEIKGEGTFSIGSSSLEINASGSSVSMDLVWGSF